MNFDFNPPQCLNPIPHRLELIQFVKIRYCFKRIKRSGNENAFSSLAGFYLFNNKGRWQKQPHPSDLPPDDKRKSVGAQHPSAAPGRWAKTKWEQAEAFRTELLSDGVVLLQEWNAETGWFPSGEVRTPPRSTTSK